jgi:hypothetical protein
LGRCKIRWGSAAGQNGARLELIHSQPPQIQVHFPLECGQIAVLIRIRGPVQGWIMAVDAPLLAERNMDIDVHQSVGRQRVGLEQLLLRDRLIHGDRRVVHRGEKVSVFRDQPGLPKPPVVREAWLCGLDELANTFFSHSDVLLQGIIIPARATISPR